MDCLRSFILNASGNINTTTYSGTYFYNNWLDIHNKQAGWNIEINPGNGFTFTIQGYKNIDIYGINANLYIQSNSQNANLQANVNDYAIQGNVIGINSSIGGFTGVITSPFILQQNNNFLITKNVRETKYFDPIKSCTEINISKIFAQGTTQEDATNIDLRYIIYMQVFYKFDGE